MSQGIDVLAVQQVFKSAVSQPSTHLKAQNWGLIFRTFAVDLRSRIMVRALNVHTMIQLSWFFVSDP